MCAAWCWMSWPKSGTISKQQQHQDLTRWPLDAAAAAAAVVAATSAAAAALRLWRKHLQGPAAVNAWGRPAYSAGISSYLLAGASAASGRPPLWLSAGCSGCRSCVLQWPVGRLLFSCDVRGEATFMELLIVALASAAEQKCRQTQGQTCIRAQTHLLQSRQQARQHAEQWRWIPVPASHKQLLGRFTAKQEPPRAWCAVFGTCERAGIVQAARGWQVHAVHAGDGPHCRDCQKSS